MNIIAFYKSLKEDNYQMLKSRNNKKKERIETWSSKTKLLYGKETLQQDKNVVLLEIGVGFNTPGIIRFPFEQMT